MKPIYVVTGGAGFIGSNLVRYFMEETEATVINVDNLTYAGNLDSLKDILPSPRHIFVQADITDNQAMKEIVLQHRPAAIFHLAAESHVDRSIDGPSAFIQTNVIGTFNLLEAALGYWKQLEEPQRQNFRFVHVSTDEVYGSLGATGLFTELTPYQPNSPYSASKAGSDHLAHAWHHTYGLPVVITNCSNNYGPYQFPEKLIPVVILNALNGRPIPVYGKGLNIRDWLYVEDHARALHLACLKGQPGGSYNIGGSNELKNIDLVQAICTTLDKIRPRTDGSSYASLITFVADRPGHDLRYAIDSTRIQQELGWRPRENFQTGLEKTVRWYLDHPDWWQRILSGQYRLERLGLGTAKSES